ncbi:MAG: hypothetical protein QJR02_06720 [Sinobacteraceae bacterium]|nr:hypothetical protein [Nevskiaceae bacterium]
MKFAPRFSLVAVVVCCGLAGPAWTADQDCAPLRALPGYQAAGDGPRRRAYDEAEFTMQRDDGTQTAGIAGAFCAQRYVPERSQSPMSDADIQSAYREQLEKDGAQVLYADEHSTDARWINNGRDLWIKVASHGGAIEVTVVARGSLSQVLTAPAGSDYPLLGHMPNYEAGTPHRSGSGALAFETQAGGKVEKVEVHGKEYAVAYHLKPSAMPNSDLDIQMNYRNALKELGAKILFIDARDTVAQLQRDGRPTWIKVSSQETSIEVEVIEAPTSP